MDQKDNSRKNECVDEDKPLKKARFLWEVKGKSELKRSSCDDSGSPLPPASIVSDASSSTSTDRQSVQGSSASASCCTEAFLAQAQVIIDEYSSDEDETGSPPTDSKAPVRLGSPRHLLHQNHKKQDYFLQKWQTRQIARGFVDNTINSMLETWESRPFDASNFVDDCESEGQVSLVEDDAILMAIQSHGLQSGWTGSANNSFNVSTLNSNSNSSFNSNLSMAGSSRSESLADTNISSSILQESSAENRENLQKEQETQSSVSDKPGSMSMNLSSSITNVYGEEMDDPMDFLNAAVSVAIQKKGLTYG